MPGVTVIVPTARAGELALPCLKTVCEALERVEEPKELLLCVDREAQPGDPVLGLALRHRFVRLIRTPWPMGAPRARILAMQSARYDRFLFTDDDCYVPVDWALELLAALENHGIVTGGICARSQQSVLADFDEWIDLYRFRATDRNGNRKFISFPCFGIRKELLPPVPFDSEYSDSADDMDLGLRLRLNGELIHAVEGLWVQTDYPNAWTMALRRKLRHARGIAYVRRRLGETAWNSLEIGSHGTILARWIGISLSAPFSLLDRLLFLALNLTYVFGLVYSYYRMKGVPQASAPEVYRVLAGAHPSEGLRKGAEARNPERASQ